MRVGRARLTDSLDQRRLRIATGARRRLWQSRQAPIGVETADRSRSVLRGLHANSYRPSGLSDGRAGAGALPQGYRCLARCPERDLLPQGARVIWQLDCRPLRLSWRSRRGRHARGAELTAIRLVMASAIIGSRSHCRCRPHQVELPAREARDRYR